LLGQIAIEILAPVGGVQRGVELLGQRLELVVKAGAGAGAGDVNPSGTGRQQPVP